EGERHEEKDDRLRSGVVASDHRGGEEHTGDDGELAGEGEGVAAAEESVGPEAAEDSTDGAAEGGQCDREASLEDRHVTRLHEVDGKPCDEEIGEGRDAELADVNSYEHSLLEQLRDARPG